MVSLGEALAQDDIADKEEWFSFKKKEDKTKLKTSTTEPERKDNEKENMEKENMDRD